MFCSSTQVYSLCRFFSLLGHSLFQVTKDSLLSSESFILELLLNHRRNWLNLYSGLKILTMLHVMSARIEKTIGRIAFGRGVRKNRNHDAYVDSKYSYQANHCCY